MVAAILIIILGSIFAFAVTRKFDRDETRVAFIAFALHVLSSFVQFGVQEFYYGISDVHVYMDSGERLAFLLNSDFPHYSMELLKVLVHLPNDIPFEIFGDGQSTGTMSALAGICVFAFGNSLLCAFLLTTNISWFGQVLFYRVCRDIVPESERSAALVGTLLVPSVVFWGAAFAKEAFVLGGFGALCFCTYRVSRDRRLVDMLGLVVGAVTVGMLKPYILFPYFLAVGAWVYASRAWRQQQEIRIRPLYLLVAAVVAIGGITAMGALFPDFAVGKVAETVAMQQALWQQQQLEDGGSTLDFGSGDAQSLGSQLRFVPLALLNSLFRPTLFESRNAPMFLAGIETSIMAYMMLRIFWRYTWRHTWRDILRSPLLVFCVVFVLSFSIAVGLASSNLGSLSRYRVPMMPFYATFLLVLNARLKARQAAAAIANSAELAGQ